MNTGNLDRHNLLDHRPCLNGWLRRRLSCPHSAEDLTQDAFVQVMGSRDLLHLEQPQALLITIAKRLLFNHYRRQDIERAYLYAQLDGLPYAEIAKAAQRRYSISPSCTNEAAGFRADRPGSGALAGRAAGWRRDWQRWREADPGTIRAASISRAGPKSTGSR
ncbi:sigma factor [Azotobacter chroococcum]|uniref:sigma factor n=1 Tax=Azotobacter chroococcum TaxID=353 RepID=UPI00201D780E|nr:sigma factor [Azotobacter chroococcum]